MALSTLYGVCISIKPTQLKLNVNTQNLTIKTKCNRNPFKTNTYYCKYKPNHQECFIFCINILR